MRSENTSANTHARMSFRVAISTGGLPVMGCDGLRPAWRHLKGQAKGLRMQGYSFNKSEFLNSDIFTEPEALAPYHR